LGLKSSAVRVISGVARALSRSSVSSFCTWASRASVIFPTKKIRRIFGDNFQRRAHPLLWFCISGASGASGRLRDAAFRIDFMQRLYEMKNPDVYACFCDCFAVRHAQPG